MSTTLKYVYSFGSGKADGRADMKDLLGGKGANLAEMSSIGIPVPPGFTITTEVCQDYYAADRILPEAVKPQVEAALKLVEQQVGKKFGDAADPLLVSVRSGAALSMPGMMNTILNLGLSDASVEGLAKKTGNARFAYDGYRRLIDMFGSTAMGVDHEEFEHELSSLKKEKKVKLDTELDANDLKELVKRYKAVYTKAVGEAFPHDPKDQLWKAIMAVFNSWMGNKAVQYRRIERITGLKGTAVNVQAMVFGNTGNNSGTGVAFTRRLHPRPQHRRRRILRRLPDQRSGRGCRGRHPHSGADQPAPRRNAQGLRSVDGHSQESRVPLQRHAGHRVHRAGWHPVHAPDPHR
jgi:pyruvate,orthophosphate dikinase